MKETAEGTEQRIRERAHKIWVEEGCPEGREQMHWDMARELVAQEDMQKKATEPNPAAKGRTRATRDEPVESLEAVENLGDLPTLTDQGEETNYPKRRGPTHRRH